MESLSSFDPIVKDSVSNGNEYIAVYMNKEFLPLAAQLQDASKNPIIEDFVFVSSTDKKITDAVLTPKLLKDGEAELKAVRINNYYTSVSPIKDISGKQVGVIAYVINATDLYNTTNKIKWGIITLCVALLAAIVVPLFFSVRSVTLSINRTITMLKDIAQGEGDLTMRLDAKSKDEIGELSFWFNTFIEKLQGIIKRIAETQARSTVHHFNSRL